MFKPKDEDKCSVVLQINGMIHQEITRYRDYEWKITIWAVGLFGSVVVAAHSPLLAINGNLRTVIQTLLVVLTVVAGVYSGWHLVFVHQKLVETWRVRRRLDIVLQLFEPGVYAEDCLLDPKWKKEIHFWLGWPHLVSWFALILVSMVYAIITICYAQR